MNEKFKNVLQQTSKEKSPPWNMTELDKVLRKLKLKQSQDLRGYSNILFHSKFIGTDLKQSLLIMFNKMKELQMIPKNLNQAYITSIPKRKKDPLSLDSERGIFMTNKLRGILMKLIYNSKKETIEKNLSQSNIGARSKKSQRDHLLVLNVIINEKVKRKRSKDIDIVFYDIREAFDSLWNTKSFMDLNENGVKDDMLNLLFEGSKTVEIKVKTPMGETEMATIFDIILQGESFSSLICTSSIDLIAKESTLPTFKYRGVLEIPKLSFIDDLADVQRCGTETKNMNEYTVREIEKRRLQFASDKCHRIHVGSKSKPCEEIYIKEWGKRRNPNNEDEEEYCKGNVAIQSVPKQEYLGSILSEDGRNDANINAKIAKGQGIINDIMTILDHIYFGTYFIEALLLLRQSLLITVFPHDIEIVYNLSNNDIKRLESLDFQLVRRALACSSKVSKAIMMLELAICPLRFHIMKRRLMYCHFLLTTNDNNLAKLFLKQQIEDPAKGDIVSYIKSDLKSLNF